MMYAIFKRTVWLVCSVGSCVLMATVTVHNETDQRIYAGIYYYSSEGSAELQTHVVPIAARQEAELQEPSVSFSKDRYLIIDTEPLKPVLPYEQFKISARVRVRLPGRYYVAFKDGSLKGYTLAEWYVINPMVDSGKRAIHFLQAPFTAKVIVDQPAVRENPYRHTQVSVQRFPLLHPHEEAYRVKRKTQVKKSLEKMLGRSLDGKYIPEIAMVVSGGGYRAMLFCAGVLSAAQQSGIFDALTYVVTLSGSTWALAYIACEHVHGRRSIANSMTELIKKTTQSFGILNPKELGLLNDVLLWKSAFDLPLTSIDLFGLFLGDILFGQYGNERYRQYLSQQAALLADGSFPFPIYTAVPAETTELEKLMYEFTPYEVRAPWGFSIPPYAFGSRFFNGTRGPVEALFPPEQPLSILLGVFGSAYAVSLARAYEEVEKKLSPDVIAALNRVRVPKDITESRIAAAKFFNFTVGMPGSVLKHKKTMKMADAGLGITGGLPFQPVSGVAGRRKMDVYIIIDISEHIDNAKGLKKIAEYAASQKVKFPHIDNYSGLDRKHISIFADKTDRTVPVVIYMPRNKDQQVWDTYTTVPEFARYQTELHQFSFDDCIEKEKGQDCTSFNLKYAPEMARKVALLGEFNMAVSAQPIKDAINDLIERKSVSP